MYIHFINYFELNQGETYLEKTFLFAPRHRSLIYWANGKFGAMVDIKNDNVFHFVEYIHVTVNGDDGEFRQLQQIEKDTYPVVASGIVVYWLKEHHGELSTAQIFNGYYDKKEKDYIQQNEKALDGWKRNFKMEFYEKHLQDVQQQIIISENIYPFLKEKDVDDIKKLEANYLEFVKSKRQTNGDNNNKELKQSESAKQMNMEETVLSNISANNINYYYDGWRKGQIGAISQENGIYRFIELTHGSSGTPHRVHNQTEDNPIVAVGIVAYWLMFKRDRQPILKKLTKYTSIPETIKDMYDNYTKERYKQFKELNRDNPNSWDWDWDSQFYTKYIIPHEIQLNKQSEALFDYISDSDIARVRAVMKSYIEYLKKTRTVKGYRVSPEVLVLRAINSGDKTKQEDLEDYEVNTILEKLEDEGYIEVYWVGKNIPWVITLLDKGRAYLKQLEEGEGVIDVAPVNTPLSSSKELSKENSFQMTQPDGDFEYNQDADDEEWDDDEDDGEYEDDDEDEVAPEVREYDTTYDYIFDSRVKPEALFNAMKGIKYHNKITERRFYYVAYRVFDAINYFSNKVTPSDFLRWINLHFNCGWIDDNKHRKQFVFALEGSSKNLEDKHPSAWDEKTIRGGSGKQHHQLAVTLKNTFTETLVEGIVVDNSDSFEHLRDRGQFLRNAYFVGDGKFFIPDDAYINNGQ